MDHKDKAETKKIDIKTSSSYMSKAVIFSFLRSYGMIPINFILTFIIARIIIEDYLGILLYALVLITGAQIILIFFPPSINSVILYKIPELLIENKIENAKGLMEYAIKVRFLLSIVIYIFYNISALFFINKDDGGIMSKVILIVAPTIIFSNLNQLFTTFNKSIKNYKLNLWIVFISKLVQIIGAIILSLVPNLEQENKLYIYSIINLSYPVISFIIFYSVYHKFFKSTKKEKVTWKSVKNYSKFGLNYSISSCARMGYDQVYSGTMNYYGETEDNAYWNVCKNITQQAIMAFSLPIGPILIDLEKTDRHEEMIQLFKISFKLILILINFIIGLLYFFIPVYILLLYPPSYFQIVGIIQNYVFSLYFIVIYTNFQTLITVLGREKIIWKLDLIGYTIMSIVSFLSMLFFDFNGLVISKLISYILLSLFYWGFIKYSFPKISIHFVKIYGQIIFLFVFIIFLNFSTNLLNLNGISSLFFNFFTKIFSFFSIDVDIESQIEIIIKSILQIVIFIFFYLFFVVLTKQITNKDVLLLEKLNLKFPLRKRIFKVLLFLTKKRS